MRRLLVLSALALASLSFGLGVGDPAPPLKFGTLVKGSPVDLTKGLHVVEFWSSAQKASQDAAPALGDLARKYKGKLDVTAVSVVEPGDDGLAAVKKFVAAQGDKMDYNVAFDGDAHPAAQAWLETSQPDDFPAAFLIKDGTILWIGDAGKGLATAVDATVKGNFDATAAKAAWDKRAAEKAALRAKAEADRAAMMELLKPLGEAMQRQDADAALKAIDDIEAKRPELKPKLEATRFSIYAGTHNPALSDLAKRFVEVDFKDDAGTLNDLAWSLIDPENEDPKADLAVALLLAKRAAEASGMKDGHILDTYALALWKTGDKKQALEMQTKAVELVKQEPGVDPDTVKELEGRLEMFRKG